MANKIAPRLTATQIRRARCASGDIGQVDFSDPFIDFSDPFIKLDPIDAKDACFIDPNQLTLFFAPPDSK